ncbi:MAG: type II secretion system F family protein, partial [Armatimonadia bacterium]|nr:type II secretion system F family protein [Armatimonadia bacterium]
MPTFAYTAKDKTGQEVQQTQEASSKEALIKSLRDQGLFPTSVEEQKSSALMKKASKKQFSFSFGKRVGLKDLSIFCRQFATMINAGVSLVRCLDVLEQQSSNIGLKEIIRDIQTEVEGGATLSKSMAKYPKVFSELAVGLVRAGEVGGVLDDTLERLAVFLEKDLELRQKIKSAMTYPILVLIVAIGIVSFLVMFILPKFMNLFLEL